MSKSKEFPSLGQRICAAVCSYNLGMASVDYYIKRYLREGEISPTWEQAGQHLLNSTLMNTEARSKAAPEARPKRGDNGVPPSP